MSWRIRELRDYDEIMDAVADAEAWQFPRKIADHEIHLGAWFRMGPAIVFWMEWPEGTSDARLHVAVDTVSKPCWPVRRWHTAVEVCAELMGARRLVMRPMPGDESVVDYAIRLGWHWDGDLMVYPLGE